MATLALPIPKPINRVTQTLTEAGFEAYLVGGCVRDLILGKTPRDWDVTTNALPDQLLTLFPHSFSNNPYGTVGVVTEDEDPTLNIVEVTPYRSEEGYSDRRRPDSVTFGVSLEEDLSRRDFTINAIALSPSSDLIDPFGGVLDISKGLLRAVGDPEVRFNEDGLRILRGLRLSAELGFAVSPETMEAMRQKAHILEHISKERVRDELIRILLSDKPADALDTARELGLLQYILPDLERSVGVEQNQAHSYDVYWHLLRTMQHAADKEWGLDIRLAGLLHDISKPETRRWSPEKNDWTFHGHEVVGARVTKKILADLKFPKKQSEKVVSLVRWHMFFSDPDKISLSAVRRIIKHVGEENIWDLLNLRICDRIGTGRPKEQPFRFRKYKAFVDEALRTPVSVALLQIDGKRIMDVTRETPGPKIGLVLHALLEEVIEDASKNTPEYLETRAGELIVLSFEELKKLGDQGRARKEQEDEASIKAIHAKHFV